MTLKYSANRSTAGCALSLRNAGPFNFLVFCVGLAVYVPPTLGQSLTVTPQMGHIGPVEVLAFDDTETLLASGGHDASCKIWDITSGLERTSFPTNVGRITAL